MGCCQSSTEESRPITANNNRSSAAARKGKEDKIELAFKAKRANIFTEGVDLGRNAFSIKHIPKNAKQTQLILSAIDQNYIFASLNAEDRGEVVISMETIQISPGENIVTQGQDGDYFYIIESGTMTVLVDNKPVATLNAGQSFGELALLYNSPRQATVRADSSASLFSLDRETYRFIVAQSSSNRNLEIKKALARVPILGDLTDDQLDKVVDAVEVFPYKAGEVIITKGQVGNIFYMIKEGTVSVTDVGEKFSDHNLTAGDYFGERALLTGEPRAATIRAVTDVKVMALDRENFDTLLGPLRDVLDHNMNLRILQSIKLFEKLSNQEKKKLAQCFQIERFAANAAIVRQGEPGKKFYIIKEGGCKVLADEKEVGVLQQGTYFGEMALLDDEVRKATVIATAATECFVIDRETFTKILGSLRHIMSRETQQRLEVLKGAGPRDDAEPQLNLNFGDLQQLAILGSGTFGRVTLVQDKKSKNVYALKAMLKSEIVAHKQQTNVINEKNVMITSNHPFILRLYQTFKDAKKLYMLLEFVQGGELFSVLHTSTSDGVPDAQAKFYGAAVISALGYLHSKEIAYRDMKPENCLIDRFGYPKLVDFGFAKVITGKSFTLCGTPEYLAPELVLAKGHNKAVDYWAYGILLYEMEAGYSPFSDPHGMDQVVICKNIVSGRLVFPKNFNADCKELVKRLLSREVQTRLGNLKNGVEDIKQHKWFETLDFDALLKRQLKAPWVPNVKSVTDTSNFDPYAADDHVDTGYVDTGNWDRDF
jgi:cGMP-dependent protein kinase